MIEGELIEVAHIECNKLLKSEKGYNGISFPEFWAEGYKKGLAEGRKEKWHDLRKDLSDLPKRDGKYLVAYRNYLNPEEIVTEVLEWEGTFLDEDHKNIPYFDCKDVLVAWRELPKFEEKEDA